MTSGARELVLGVLTADVARGDLDERHQAVEIDALVEAVVRDEPRMR